MACNTVSSLCKLFCFIDVEHDLIRLIRYDPKDNRTFLIFDLDVATSSSSSDDSDNAVVKYIRHRYVDRNSVEKLFKNSISSKGGPLETSILNNCGLICLYNRIEFCVANPLNKEELVHLPHPRLTVDLPHSPPPPPRIDNSGCSNIEHCVLVFHPGRNEYILVAFFPEGTQHGFLFYRTFTLGISKSWSAEGMALYPVLPRQLVSVGGSLYWLHREGIDCRVIVSFDVSEGKFRDIHTVWGQFSSIFLMESYGSLFLVSFNRDHDTLDIAFIRDPLNDYNSPPPEWQNIIIPLNEDEDKDLHLNMKPICIQNVYVVLTAQWKYHDPVDSKIIILKPETIVYDIKNRKFFYVYEYHDLCAVDLFMRASLQVSSSLIGGGNVSKVMETPNLLEEILSRIPARSLSKFKCVSQLWHNKIDNPKFITLCYENYIRNFPSPIYLTTYSKKHNCIVLSHLLDANNDQAWRPRKFLPALDKRSTLWISHSTCNGLVCLYNRTQVFVCNPMTREVLSLPSIEDDKGDEDDCCLLTFVPTTGEYKVVRLCHRCQPGAGFIIFTLGVSKSWSSFTYPPHGHRFHFYSYSKIVAMNGMVFCIQDRELGGHIISFDVSKLVFDKIESPKEVSGAELFLVQLQGRLSLARSVLFSGQYYNKITIWTKDEISARGSWTEIAEFQYGAFNSRHVWKPVYMDKGKIYFVAEKHSCPLMVSAYDIEDKKFTFIRQIVKDSCIVTPFFAASLFSLNKFREVMID